MSERAQRLNLTELESRANRRPGWRRVRQPDTVYAHATGRLRVIESWNLDWQDYVNFASPQSSTTQRHQILTAAGYPEAQSLEARAIAARRRIDHLLCELTGDGPLARGLLLDRSYHNLKLFTKSLVMDELSGQGDISPETLDAAEAQAASARARDTGLVGLPADAQELVMYDRLVKPAQLWDLVLRQHARPEAQVTSRHLPAWLVEDCWRLLTAYNEHPDLVTIDQMGDRLYFARLWQLAEASETGSASEFLLDYLAILADTANLQMLARTRLAGSGQGFLRRVVVVGGEIPAATVARFYEADDEQLRNAWRHTMMPWLVEHALNYDSREGIWSFGQAADGALARLSDIGRHASFGPDAVGAFWLDRTMEIRALRVLISGLEQGYSGEELLRMMPASERRHT